MYDIKDSNKIILNLLKMFRDQSRAPGHDVWIAETFQKKKEVKERKKEKMFVYFSFQFGTLIYVYVICEPHFLFHSNISVIIWSTFLKTFCYCDVKYDS